VFVAMATDFKLGCYGKKWHPP